MIVYIQGLFAFVSAVSAIALYFILKNMQKHFEEVKEVMRKDGFDV